MGYRYFIIVWCNQMLLFIQIVGQIWSNSTYLEHLISI